MVADAYGKFYIISPTIRCLKVDIDSRTATYVDCYKADCLLTTTTNGAAVDDDGKVVVSLAQTMILRWFYKFDMK